MHDEHIKKNQPGICFSGAALRCRAGSYLAAADAATSVHVTASGSGVILPGSKETIQLQISAGDAGTLHLTILSMLVNTNDAVAAVSNQSVAGMAVGETLSFSTVGYDSGTEANTETADTVPGPAAAGGAQEGFNAAREDVRDAVYLHAGVVTAEDGMAGSVLTAVNRWDNPVMQVMVERTE